MQGRARCIRRLRQDYAERRTYDGFGTDQDLLKHISRTAGVGRG